MRLSIGIVGLPNVGKSTLFNALTNAGALAANYPFATIDPNTGVVPIPDPRLDTLAAMFGSAEITPATVTFVDIAGLVEGASRGEGLGNQFLGNIRDVTAICHVVRAFESSNVARVDHDTDPERDIDVIETELAIADLETIHKRLGKLEKEAAADRSLLPGLELLRSVREVVAAGDLVSARPGLMERRDELAELHLLTAKPVIYVFNADETLLADDGRRKELAELVAPSEALFIDAQLESELAELDPADRDEMLEEVGLDEPGLNVVIRAAHRTLGLQSFLTANENEASAWTIRAGATAAEAAGAIHTDFQRGFISAEVVDFDTLVDAGSWQSARSRGLIRTEGRSYVMRPGDVAEFRFNV